MTTGGTVFAHFCNDSFATIFYMRGGIEKDNDLIESFEDEVAHSIFQGAPLIVEVRGDHTVHPGLQEFLKVAANLPNVFLPDNM